LKPRSRSTRKLSAVFPAIVAKTIAPTATLVPRRRIAVAVLSVAVLLLNAPAYGASGTWTLNGSGNWSTTGNWASGIIADGAGFTGNITMNINGARIATIDGTSRTLGILNVGDTNNNNSYTIASSGGATLTFDNTPNSANAQLNQTSGSNGDAISAPILLKSSLDISNNASPAATLTISGTIASSATSGTQTITNKGTASGDVTISGVIGNGSTGGTVAVTQNSSSSALTLSGATANTYTGLTTVSAGTLNLGKTASVNAFGGDLTINGGTVAYGSTSNEQISDSAKVTISSGSFAVGARTETIGITIAPASGLALSGTGAITIGSGTLHVVNGAMTGGTITLTAGSGALQANNDFNFSGGTIDFTSASGTSTAAFNLRGGNGTGITYSASGTTTAQITNTGGGSARVSLNTAAASTNVFNIADSASVTTEMIIAIPITGGTSAVQKTGAGVLVFSGANTYTVATQINGGTLQLGNGGSTGSLSTSSTITDNANFTINRNNAVVQGTDFSGSAITGTGSFTQAGSGTTTLNAANTYAGDTTISAGTLKLGAANVIPDGAGKGNVSVSGTFDMNGFSEAINGLSGNGTVDNTAASTTPTLTVGNNNQTSLFGGVIKNTAGTLGLTKNGNGTLTLTGTSTYSGTTTINGGSVVLGNATNTLPDTGFVDVVAGTLSLGNNNDTVGNVTLETGSITGTGGTLTSTNYDFRSGTVTANLAGTGTTLTKSTSGGLSLTGTNTYSGGTTINGGDVTFNNSSALGSGAINFGPNGLDSMSLMSTAAVSLSNNISINDLSATVGRTATLGSSSTASVGTNAYTGTIALSNDLNIKSSSPTSNPLTFSGVISGTKGLIINPNGTISPGAVQFTGNNSYQGGTVVNGGSLVVSNTAGSGTGSGTVTVDNSGTLGGTGSIAGSTTINGGANITGATSGTVGSLTLQSNLTLSGASSSSLATYVVDLTSLSSDRLVIGGTFDLSGLNDQISFQGTTGASSYTLATYNLGSLLGVFDHVTNLPAGYVLVYGPTELDLMTPVPEPSTWLAGGLAFATLLCTQRKRLRFGRRVLG